MNWTEKISGYFKDFYRWNGVCVCVCMCVCLCLYVCVFRCVPNDNWRITMKLKCDALAIIREQIIRFEAYPCKIVSCQWLRTKVLTLFNAECSNRILNTNKNQGLFTWTISVSYLCIMYITKKLNLKNCYPAALSRIYVIGFLSHSDSWPVRMGPIRCPETSANNYHTTRNTPQGRRFHQHRGRSLKSRTEITVSFLFAA